MREPLSTTLTFSSSFLEEVCPCIRIKQLGFEHLCKFRIPRGRERTHMNTHIITESCQPLCLYGPHKTNLREVGSSTWELIRHHSRTAIDSVMELHICRSPFLQSLPVPLIHEGGHTTREEEERGGGGSPDLLCTEVLIYQ